MHRYLLHISYLGTTFRGSQRQIKRTIPVQNDPSTVQGCVEMGLQLLNPYNDPKVRMASRTDAGVHALNAYCHVDLHRENGLIYEPSTITICLNKYFSREDIPVRLIRSYLVPDEFHSGQNSLSRTYLYRMVVAPADKVNIASTSLFVPLEEWQRSLFFCTNLFDLDAMRQASKLLVGTYDFRTFMAKQVGDEEKITRKTVESIRIVEAPERSAIIRYWPEDMIEEQKDYKYFDIYFTGRGFLYKQVRRMMATLIAVAQHKLTFKDVKLMLQIPSKDLWFSHLKTVPSHGLYLQSVQYSPEDLKTFQSHIETEEK